jgi:hypothetical protein
MNYIPGLDKWLTTEPESTGIEFEDYREDVIAAMGGDWEDRWEDIARTSYDNCEKPSKCADRIQEFEMERAIEGREYHGE